MNEIIILHTNDIHGRDQGLSRIASLIEQIKAAHPHTPVLYFDLGDSEEYTHRLSSLTKGSAMHRLLEAAGCQAVVVGNAMLVRFGSSAVEMNAEAVRYPHLLANIFLPENQQLPGTIPHTILLIDQYKLGLIGVSAFMDGYERFHQLKAIDPLECIQKNAATLRELGAQNIIVLSHMGLEEDRRLAHELEGQVSLILGGHSHTRLPEGEWVGDVLIAQAGQYAEHLGRVDLEWQGGRWVSQTARLLPIDDSIPPSPAVTSMLKTIEDELVTYLGEVICRLPRLFDYATDRECLAGNLMADALRWGAKAELGLVVPGPVFNGDLPAGDLTRERLWSLCHSPGNPGEVKLPGKHLADLIQRGLDPELAADRHPGLRGQARGFVHLSGAEIINGQVIHQGQPLQPDRIYHVAASDFEFEPVWGYTHEEWALEVSYDTSVIMRDVLDDYLRGSPDLAIRTGRSG
jgi:2',3'-cyclic-nucleotide 2'-phosphodiesterase (5'-nucleotidase family)